MFFTLKGYLFGNLEKTVVTTRPLWTTGTGRNPVYLVQNSGRKALATSLSLLRKRKLAVSITTLPLLKWRTLQLLYMLILILYPFWELKYLFVSFVNTSLFKTSTDVQGMLFSTCFYFLKGAYSFLFVGKCLYPLIIADTTDVRSLRSVKITPKICKGIKNNNV